MPIARICKRDLEPLRMESDGVWEALLPGSVDMGGHGFNATLQGLGPLRSVRSRGGELQSGERLLPPDWIRDSTRWTRARAR